MDSDRRHELETNDLKEFLDNFKDFWEKHGNKVLIVLIVALLAYAGPKYYADWKKGKANDAAEALSGATSAEALLAVADEHPMVSDEATRKAGDMLLAAARTALIDDDADAATKALDKAKPAYTAIAQRGKTVLYQLAGYEGLAKIAIMQGEWDLAKTNYDKLIELAGETYSVYAARAKSQLDKLPRLQNVVAFAPPQAAPIDPVLPGLGTDPAGPAFNPALPDLTLPDLTPPPTLDPLDSGTGSGDADQ